MIVRLVLGLAAVGLVAWLLILDSGVLRGDEVAPAEPATAPPTSVPPAPTSAVADGGGSEVAGASSVEPATATAPQWGDPVPGDGVVRVTVRRVADGDSFDVSWVDPKPDGLRRDEVRLQGINAPERGSCFATEARAELERLIGDAEIALVIAADERDDFGRAIANAWSIDGVHLNLALVERGAALSQRDGGPYAAELLDAQAAARAGGQGLWARCVAGSTVAFGALEADAAGRDDRNPNGEWVEVTNAGLSIVDLTGWTIRDESTRNRFGFPDGFMLEPAATVRIGSGCVDDPAGPDIDLYWCADDPVWNNSGDTAFLVDADGRFVDQRSYG